MKLRRPSVEVFSRSLQGLRDTEKSSACVDKEALLMAHDFSCPRRFFLTRRRGAREVHRCTQNLSVVYWSSMRFDRGCFGNRCYDFGRHGVGL